MEHCQLLVRFLFPMGIEPGILAQQASTFPTELSFRTLFPFDICKWISFKFCKEIISKNASLRIVNGQI